MHKDAQKPRFSQESNLKYCIFAKPLNVQYYFHTNSKLEEIEKKEYTSKG